MATQDISARAITAGGSIHNFNSGNVVNSGSGTVYVGLPDQQLRELAEWVSDLDFSQHQSQMFERYTKGTLLWVLKEPRFVVWLENGGMLWCPGKPGAGKSVFVSFIVNHLQKHSELTPKPVVCYVYCRYYTTLTTLQLFEAVLKQLLLRGSLPDVVKRVKHAKDRQERLTVDDILSMLKESSLTTANIFIIFDALDECFNEQTRHQVLLQLQELTSIHILITSRPLPSIENAMGSVATLPISAQAQDLQIYLEAKTRSNPSLRKILPDDSRTDVEDKVIEKADGMFLLAHLHTENLARQTTTADLLRVAEDLPTEAAQTYEATLQRIRERDENERRLAFHTLSWVLHAPEPLSLMQLRHALATHLGRVATKHELADEETIVSSCAGLIIVNRDEERSGKERWNEHEDDSNDGDEDDDESDEDEYETTVSFLHYTVQEFLQSACPTNADMLSEVQIAIRCMKVISFPDLPSDPFDYPFFEYAADTWGFLVQQYESVEEVLQLVVSQLRDTFPVLRAIGLDKYDISLPSAWFPTALHYIVQFDLVKTCEAFLSRNDPDTMLWINEQVVQGRTPLSWAAGRGHLTLVKQLLTIYNIDVNPKDPHDERTPLSLAACNGHFQVVQELLRHPRTDVNSEDITGRTPLSWAAGHGHMDVVRELLRHSGTDTNSKDNMYGRTPLSYAAQYGHLGVVQDLLDHPSTDANSKDNMYGRTPLSYAAQYGHLGVVQDLLGHPSTDADFKDTKYGRTPLSWAVLHRQSEVVKELLRHPAVDPNSKDTKYGGTPLSWATEGGCLEVVKELLCHPGVDINSKDTNGMTPFSWAAAYGPLDVAEELLSHPQIRVSLSDHLGRTPLFYAVHSGRSAIVHQLLRHPDVTINSRDLPSDLTPLIWATLCQPHRSRELLLVVDLLIETGKAQLPGKRRFSSATSSQDTLQDADDTTVLPLPLPAQTQTQKGKNSATEDITIAARKRPRVD